jgi:hypothetical protein
MPVRRVKGGYRYGRKGKVYPTKRQVKKQGIAIKINQKKQSKR